MLADSPNFLRGPSQEPRREAPSTIHKTAEFFSLHRRGLARGVVYLVVVGAVFKAAEIFGPGQASQEGLVCATLDRVRSVTSLNLECAPTRPGVAIETQGSEIIPGGISGGSNASPDEVIPASPVKTPWTR